MLYGPTAYFADGSVVSSPPQPLDFRALTGESDYRRHVARLYAAGNASAPAGAWLTPCELFQPHYSVALARYALRTLPRDQPLTVIEVGGGSGVNANAFLSHVAATAPDAYADASYTCVDISPGLHERQAATAQPHAAAGCFHTVCADATRDSDWGDVPARLRQRWASGPVLVVLLEVLDNLGHDKVVFDAAHGGWMETWVTDVHGDGSHVVEEARPATDAAVCDALATLLGLSVTQPLRDASVVPSTVAAPVVGAAESPWRTALSWLLEPQVGPSPLVLAHPPDGAGDDDDAAAVFLPTGALQLLRALARHAPDFHLLAADFDRLPPPAAPRPPCRRVTPLPCATHNQPLVCGRHPDDGAVCDFDSWLGAPSGGADIFFATDFVRLAAAAAAVHPVVPGGRFQLWPSGTFLCKHGDVAATTTRSGWNPMLQDYTNTQFITGPV